MNMKSFTYCVFMVTSLAGCAADTTHIQASYVSPYVYGGYTCEMLRGEAARITHNVTEIGARIDETAEKDSVGAAIGLILPTSWLMIKGDDPADIRQYAELKGRMNGIEEVSIRKGCDIEFKHLRFLEDKMHRLSREVRRLHRAAEQGDAEAQITLGSL